MLRNLPSSAHRVTMETDAGAVTMAFGYAAIGEPVYSDVPAQGPWMGTESEAEVYGARLVGLGNWWSFTVEKRFTALNIAQEKESSDAA